MNIFKHIFVMNLLIISCNAFAMFGFGQDLRKQSSTAKRKEAQFTMLCLRATGKEQARFTELVNKGDLRTKPENKEVIKIARRVYKDLHGLPEQKENREILKSSDPHKSTTPRRRCTL
jgi:hypothetical protein